MKLRHIWLIGMIPVLSSCPSPDMQFQMGVRNIKSGYELTEDDRSVVQEGIKSFFNGKFNAELETMRANQVDATTVRVCGLFIPRDADWRPVYEPMYFVAGNLSTNKDGKRVFLVITVDGYGVGDAIKRISAEQACGVK
jgi:hypothetical protein